MTNLANLEYKKYPTECALVHLLLIPTHPNPQTLTITFPHSSAFGLSFWAVQNFIRWTPMAPLLPLMGSMWKITQGIQVVISQVGKDNLHPSQNWEESIWNGSFWVGYRCRSGFKWFRLNHFVVATMNIYHLIIGRFSLTSIRFVYAVRLMGPTCIHSYHRRWDR